MGSTRPRGPRSGIDVDCTALRQARIEAGLSLSQVAGSEMTRQAVHLIETGKVRPSRRSLAIIANRLGLPESVLLQHPAGQTSAEEAWIAELERLCQRHEYGLALERAERAMMHPGSRQLLAFAHHYAGLALYHTTRPEEAIGHLRCATERFEALNDPWWAAESMDWEAMALHMLERPESLRVGRTALRQYRGLEPRRPETEARMLEHIATIHYGRRDYDRGRASYEAALAVAGGVRELARIARIHHGLAMCHQGLGNLSQAADLMFKAVTLYEAEQRISPRPLRSDVPRAENDLGLIAMEQGDLTRAEELFQSALAHFAEAGIERFQSHVLLSLADLRSRQRRYEEALDLVREAIDRAQHWGETLALTAAYRQLGELHAARGDDRLADDSFQHALGLLQAAGLEARQADTMRAYERVLAERRPARRRRRMVGA